MQISRTTLLSLLLSICLAMVAAQEGPPDNSDLEEDVRMERLSFLVECAVRNRTQASYPATFTICRKRNADHLEQKLNKSMT